MAGRSKLVRENFQVPPPAEPPKAGKARPAVRARKAAAAQAEKTPKLSKPRRAAAKEGKAALTTGQRKAAASEKKAAPPRPAKDRGFEEKGKRGRPKAARVSTTRAKTRSGTARTKPRVQQKVPSRSGAAQ
jgi:hypothetical protein